MSLVLTVGHEDSAEKPVDEEHLADDVDEVECVAKEVLEGVQVVAVEGVDGVLDQEVALLLPVLQVEGAAPQVLGDLAELAVLQDFPQPVGDVEEHALEEQDEGHPLVVGVDNPVLALLVGLDTLVGIVLAVDFASLG